MVEGIDTQDIATDADRLLEEVEELTDIVLAQLRELEAHHRHVAIEVGKDGTCLRILIDEVDLLPGEVIEPVEIVLILRYDDGAAWLRDAHKGLEEISLPLLDHLTDGVEVGGEVRQCGEDTLPVLPLALGEELLPPLTDVVEARVEVIQDLDHLAVPVEGVAGRSIADRHILLARDTAPDMLLHILRSSHERPDVAAGSRQRYQSHRREDCEAASHWIRDDKGLIALIIGELA